MTHIEEQEKQFKDLFKRLLNRKIIYKNDVLGLKKQAKKMSECDDRYKKVFNSITTHVNAMKGVLSDERRTKLNNLFNVTFENNGFRLELIQLFLF